MRQILLVLLAFTVNFTMGNVSAEEIYNLSYAKKLVRNYYESGQYNYDISKIAKEAETYLQLRVSENNSSKQPKKLAIVLDIDDTSLSNYPALNQTDFDVNHFDEYIRNARAPAIKPILHLYNLALNQGVKVFFVTMRDENFRASTIKNLQAAGYHDWQQLYLYNHQQKTSVLYKTAMRKKITSQGYHIILSMGDEYSDIEGGYADKTFKLPNLMYTYASVPSSRHNIH